MPSQLRKTISTLLTPFRGLGLRKFAVVRTVLGKLKPSTAIVRGRTMHLDPADFAVSAEISAGDYEAMEVSIVETLIRPNDTVVDIGANIGFFTLIFAELAKRGTVHAFEPAPETFQLLRKNVVVNGFDHVQLHESAVGDKNGKTELFINEYNKGDNRVYPSFGAKGVSIQIATLDSVIPEGTKVDLIKMDVQGFEVYALRGMDRVLKENPDLFLLTECWPKGLKKAGASIEEFFAEIERAEFSWCVIDDEKRVLRMDTKESYIARFPADQDAYANLLCWRNRVPNVSIVSQ